MSTRVMLLGLFSLLVACATIPSTTKEPITYDAAVNAPAPFVEHAGPEKMQSYLAMNLPYPPIEAIRKNLEKRLGRELMNRGEAHITVITPIEFDQVLGSKISMKKINSIAIQAGMQDDPVQFLCVGRGSANLNGRGEQTYFLVVKAPRLLEIRRAIKESFVKAGGDPDAFDADRFFPHVTLGFTKRDLHFEDGVIKDESSCLAPLIKATP